MAINLRLSNIPPVTKATLIACFLLSLLCAAFRYRLYIRYATTSTDQVTEQQLLVPFLTVVPGLSYLFPWTFVTAAFVQLNIFSVRIPRGWRLTDSLLEHWWFCYMLEDTLREHGRQRSMPNLSPYARLSQIFLDLASAWYYTISPPISVCCMLFLFLSDYRSINISGLAGLQCAYLIAFKQLVPEHTVTLLRSPIKIRVKVPHLHHVSDTSTFRDCICL